MSHVHQPVDRSTGSDVAFYEFCACGAVRRVDRRRGPEGWHACPLCCPAQGGRMEDTERERGVKAIIELQRLAGVTEPRERAERSWDGFSAAERERTLSAYEVFVAGRDD